MKYMILGAVAILFAAATVMTHKHQSHIVSSTPSTLVTSGPRLTQASQSTKAAGRPIGTKRETMSPLTSIRQRMKIAMDYYALAKEILPLAESGNPEAQYVLYEAYVACHFNAAGAESESLAAARSEALRLFPTAPQLVSKYEDGYTRCHGFFTADPQSLGDPWDWLQKATDAGYAPAQAATASERFMQDDLKAAVRAGGSPTYPTAYRAPIGGDANPRELLGIAVQSADPDVLVEISQLQHWLSPAEPRDIVQINRTAWMYVACQRGADCSGYGPATVTNCGPNDAQCTPVPERFLAQVNYNWAPVLEKVDQINAALNAKQWDQLGQLGLGPG